MDEKRQQNFETAIYDLFQTLVSVVDRVRRQQVLNNHILAVLGSHTLALDEDYAQQSLVQFKPPQHPRADELRQLGPLLADSRLNKNLVSLSSANTSSTNIYGHQNEAEQQQQQLLGQHQTWDPNLTINTRHI